MNFNHRHTSLFCFFWSIYGLVGGGCAHIAALLPSIHLIRDRIPTLRATPLNGMRKVQRKWDRSQICWSGTSGGNPVQIGWRAWHGGDPACNVMHQRAVPGCTAKKCRYLGAGTDNQILVQFAGIGIYILLLIYYQLVIVFIRLYGLAYKNTGTRVWYSYTACDSGVCAGYIHF